MKKIKDIKSKLPINEQVILIADTLKKSKEFVLIHPEHKIYLWNFLRLRWRFYLRQKNYSTARILGHKEFFGLNFLVNKHTLIPRPDSELMVEEILSKIKEKDTLVDVGTGSGCILISVLKNSQVKNAFGLDISRGALKITKNNSRVHGVEANFFKSYLLNKFFRQIKKGQIKLTGNLFVAANLPYLTEKQFQDEPSIQKEPKTALVASNEGLELYEKLLEQIKLFIETKSNNPFPDIHLFLEIDPTQTDKIKTIIKTILPQANIEIKKDLSGKDRLVIINL